MSKKFPLYILAVVLVSSLVASLILIVNDPGVGNWTTNLLNPGSTQSQTNLPTRYVHTDDENSEGPFRVVKVRDGDTIELENGMVVRYLYVDTPETVKPSSEVQCFGPESSQYNKEFVYDKMVRLVKDKSDTDQYNRQLRLVYIDGKDTTKPEQSINADLVKLGFARAKFYSPNTKYKNEFQSMEKEAKDKQLGLWKTCNITTTKN